MLKLVSATPGACIVALVATEAWACDLRMMPSDIFGPSCNALVGFYNAVRIGPFHIALPDGSVVTAGTCEGYFSVLNVQGNVVSLGAFHSVRPRVYTLADDCRGTVKLQ
jgi:hypothetical protein